MGLGLLCTRLFQRRCILTGALLIAFHLILWGGIHLGGTLF